MEIYARSQATDGSPLRYKLGRAPCGTLVWIFMGYSSTPCDVFIPKLNERDNLAKQPNECMREFLEGDLNVRD